MTLSEMKSVPEDMDVPQMRRDISKVSNVFWLLRNLGIDNRTHPKFNETMSMLQNICRANQDDSFIKGMRMTLTASELVDQLRSINTEDLLEAVRVEHRTNQQLLANKIFAIVRKWSLDYENNAYDLRNEETCVRSNKMLKSIIDDTSLPYR